MPSQHAPLDHEGDAGQTPFASDSKWKHQESSRFHAWEGEHAPSSTGAGAARKAEKVNDAVLDGGGGDVSIEAKEGGEAAAAAPALAAPAHDSKEIAVGPLLNYRRMEGSRWIGSVLVVTRGGGKDPPPGPILRLWRADLPAPAASVSAPAAPAAVNGASPGATGGDGSNNHVNGGVDSTPTEIQGFCLYSDPRTTFWRFDLAVELDPAAEARWEYELPGLQFASATKPRRNAFYVPSATQSMRTMFHSCNGFSAGTDEAAWSGPALWRDVQRRHEARPFHVMIGGGDQIYNDAIRVKGPLRAWTDIGNPKKRRDYPFSEQLRAQCDGWYLNNYIKWYGTDPFDISNGQIPQLNIWDDHDIIDGFGSYVHDFMLSPVFRGIGGTAHKYYLLFQHHLPPPPSTYTSDMPVSSASQELGQGIDPKQLVDTYVHAPLMTESSYIVGSKPGPYVAEHSRSMFAKLGERIAFLGIDARTERTRRQVNYPETYDRIFERARQELSAATTAGQPFRHFILLLGIPIAYPRLTWLENIFSSPVMGPLKFMNRRFGVGGGLFNHFDGSVNLLDDLDDHYTARTHKKERNRLVGRLQRLSAEHSVRITILGGDVHLAAVGRFYPADRDADCATDYRYMVNIVSSAICNKPPPGAIANLLARRNKIHHLGVGTGTDETLMPMFDKNPGVSSRTAGHNHVTMPSRNFAILTENAQDPIIPAASAAGEATTTAAADPTNHISFPVEAAAAAEAAAVAAAATVTSTTTTTMPTNGDGNTHSQLRPPGSSAGQSVRSRLSKHSSAAATGAIKKTSKYKSRVRRKDGHSALQEGEVGAGTRHRAANVETHGRAGDGGLDVCICIEMDQHDPEGRTEGYGMSIPALDYRGPQPPPPRPRIGETEMEETAGVGARAGVSGTTTTTIKKEEGPRNGEQAKVEAAPAEAR